MTEEQQWDNLPAQQAANMMTPAKAQRLKALQVSNHAIEVWQPAEGESLAGVITGSQKASGAYGQGTQALIQDADGKVWAVWLTTWLSENFKAQGAEIGDLCVITFLGKKTGGFGKTYNAYSLVVEKDVL